MNDFVVKHVPLSGDLSPQDAPSLSLHVLAKNAESVLGRLCDHIAPYIRLARFVLNDTTDRSADVIGEHMAAHPSVDVDVQHATSASHPDFYFQDTRASYEVGRGLGINDYFDGPFTEKPLLADWAGVRNLGWDSNTDWKIFLDADDLIDDVSKLPGVVRALQEIGAEMAASRYTFSKAPGGKANSTAYRDRLALNNGTIKWSGKTHESMHGATRHVLLDDCLSVTDLRDNQGEGLRVPGRCFKVLYREARLCDWNVPSRHLAYLMQESPGLMPLEWMSSELLAAYLQVATNREEIAWVYSMVGEGWEKIGNLTAAGLHYANALESFPSSKTAWRLCRVFFRRGDWQSCIEAYQKGIDSMAVPQLLDLGSVYEHSTKILVAQAHYELGNMDMAKMFIAEACAAFPDDPNVALLKESICGTKEG